MMNVWFRVIDGVIYDAVDYEVDGYVSAMIEDEHLPSDIYSGVYRFDGERYIFDQQLLDALLAGE